MIVQIDIETVFKNLQHQFMIKQTNKQKTFPEKILNGEKPKVFFSKIRKNMKAPTLITIIQYNLEALAMAIREEK